MEWTTVLWIALGLLFLFVMLRGCGGVMGGGKGGCGGGGRSRGREARGADPDERPPDR